MNMRTPPALLDEDIPDEPSLNNETQVDFSEYMWMADELEEFDRQVLEELREEAFIEACFEEMLAEEEAQWCVFSYGQDDDVFFSDLEMGNDFIRCFPFYDIDREEMVKYSNLNPDAPEFVPRSVHS